MDARVFFYVQEIEQRPLFGVIRAGRIPWSGANAPVPFTDQLFMGQCFTAAIPPVFPSLFVQPFGERLRQPIGQGFRHDRVIIIVFLLKPLAQGFDADAGRDRERAEVIGQMGRFRSDKSGECLIELPLRFVRLLAERVEGHEDRRA